MRRVGALLAALALVASTASSGLAATAGRQNSFYGNFDLLEYYGTTVVAHVVATVHEPTDTDLVPGSLDIYWKSGDVRESHAQVIQAHFWENYDPAEGSQLGAFLHGYLCDYTAPQAGSCQPFAIVFVKSVNTAFPNHVGFELGDMTCCDTGPWYDVGTGAFAMNWVRPTP